MTNETVETADFARVVRLFQLSSSVALDDALAHWEGRGDGPVDGDVAFILDSMHEDFMASQRILEAKGLLHGALADGLEYLIKEMDFWGGLTGSGEASTLEEIIGAIPDVADDQHRMDLMVVGIRRLKDAIAELDGLRTIDPLMLHSEAVQALKGLMP